MENRMTDDQSVVVVCHPTGRVSVEANGFQGVGCTEATEQIEIVLGSKTKREPKPEYYQSPAANIANSVKQDF